MNVRNKLFLAALAHALVLPTASAQTFNDGYQMYLGGYPIAETSWSNDCQGIAHDDNNWFITQTEVLWKIPVQLDLRTVTASSSGVIRRALSSYPALAGYHHTGDLVVHRFNGVDYLLVPLEGPPLLGTIAVFNCATLNYITHAELHKQAGDAGWCAVDSAGVLYSSLQHASFLKTYDVNWPLLASSGILSTTARTPEAMFDESGAPLDLVTMQGGEFAPGGQLLYLISGFYDDSGGLEDREGIHVLQREVQPGGAVTWRRVGHSTRGFGHFDFYYDPGFPTYEEPEGLTIWDLDDGRAPGIRGQLHAMVSDNDIEAGDIDLKHYTFAIHVNATSTCQTGTPTCPFRTVTAAANLAWDGSEIRIQGGTYNGPLTLSRRVRLTAQGGLVRIGH
jgi:hypothetical protein